MSEICNCVVWNQLFIYIMPNTRQDVGSKTKRRRSSKLHDPTSGLQETSIELHDGGGVEFVSIGCLTLQSTTFQLNMWRQVDVHDYYNV